MNAQIREAAAQWLVEFRTDTPDVAPRREFTKWLRTSPDHIRAYLELLALWEDACCYDPQRKLDLYALEVMARPNREITDLRTDDSYDGAADIPAPAKRDRLSIVSRKTGLSRKWVLRTAIAVLGSLLINGAVTWFAVDSQSVAYNTHLAERRSVALTDGSRIDLDALTNVHAHLTRHERTVELLAGEALFHVSKDAKRPFVVSVNDVRVRAVGTEFNVNRTALGTVVTVLEGRVAVSVSTEQSQHFFGASATSDGAHPVATGGRGKSEGGSVEVDAGQQTTIAQSSIAAPQAVDTALATGWTRGFLIFASTPLSNAAEEFNRFNLRRIVIANPELVNLHVTGTFRASDPESLHDFVLFLRQQPGINVIETDDEIKVQTGSVH